VAHVSQFGDKLSRKLGNLKVTPRTTKFELNLRKLSIVH